MPRLVTLLLCAVSEFPLKQQGQRRAGGDGTRGLPVQAGGHRLAVNDGVSPLIKRDELGQELGAKAMAGAGGRVDQELLAHRRLTSSPTRRPERRRAAAGTARGWSRCSGQARAR